MKHKHYDLIVAWAAGEKIEVLFHGLHGKTLWVEEDYPEWHENVEYRLAKKKEISWREILYPHNSIRDIVILKQAAEYLGYDYFAWNGTIRETSTGEITQFVPV